MFRVSEVAEEKPILTFQISMITGLRFSLFRLIQDLFHVFLNNFEKVIFLLCFKLFIIFFLHYVSVIFKKREPQIKLFFTAFVHFKLRCKMSGFILKCAKKSD